MRRISLAARSQHDRDAAQGLERGPAGPCAEPIILVIPLNVWNSVESGDCAAEKHLSWSIIHPVGLSLVGCADPENR